MVGVNSLGSDGAAALGSSFICTQGGYNYWLELQESYNNNT
jgi:hypothetical protein